MEPTFTTGQVVVYYDKENHVFYPAIVKEVEVLEDQVEYRIDQQTGTGDSLRAEENLVSQDAILTFREFAEAVKTEVLEGLGS